MALHARLEGITNYGVTRSKHSTRIVPRTGSTAAGGGILSESDVRLVSSEPYHVPEAKLTGVAESCASRVYRLRQKA